MSKMMDDYVEWRRTASPGSAEWKAQLQASMNGARAELSAKHEEPTCVVLPLPSGWFTVKLSRAPEPADMDRLCQCIRDVWGDE